jgi:hypothetical protein
VVEQGERVLPAARDRAASGFFNCADNLGFPGSDPNPCIENPIIGYASNCDTHCSNNLDCDPWCNSHARKNGRRGSAADVKICSCAKVCF